ncbi:MAG: hypothetical protein WA664_17710, partial [Candidatus Acidiferrales bacterium]
VMKKSIGRTLAHIDVTANTSVRIHEEFFNSHRIHQHLSRPTCPSPSAKAHSRLSDLSGVGNLPDKSSLTIASGLPNTPPES